jgi:hypothetical protein
MARLEAQSTISHHKHTQKNKSKCCPDIGRICIFAQMEPEIKDWLFELQDDERLNIALKAFKAIDQQMQIGAVVREVVGQAIKEIRSDFGNVKDDMGVLVNNVKESMDKSARDYLSDIIEQTKASKEETEKRKTAL